MAEPVLLISSDPFLGASLEAVARGRLQIARLDPTHRPPAWPATPSTIVVLDVTTRQRDPIHTWVRRHHPGPLVILLKPGERQPDLPPDPWRVVVARPFRLIELVGLLERSPKPPARAPVPEARVREAEDEPEEDEEEEGEGDEEQEGDNGETERQPHLAGTELAPKEGEREPGAPDGGPPLGRVADRRELGAPLSTPPPPPSSPLPRPDWPTAATRIGVRRLRPGWRVRRVVTRVLAGVLVVLLLAGGWLMLGLLQARQDLLVGAAGVRDELARADVALTRGRPSRPPSGVLRWRRRCQSGGRCGSRLGCRCCREGSRTPGGCWRRRPG